MNYDQLVTPTPNISCTPGECLVYVQRTFSISAKYPTAIAAWNASTNKHQDQNWPALWFPVWFSVNGNPAGHVALHAPDHSIYSSSSPTSNTPVHHSSLAAMQQYWVKGTLLKYLGWTEDVEGTLVIKGEDMYQGKSAQDWAAIANDALAYKEQVINTKAWASPLDMSYVVDRIGPSIDDLYSWKYPPTPASPVAAVVDVEINGQKYVPETN